MGKGQIMNNEQLIDSLSDKEWSVLKAFVNNEYGKWEEGETVWLDVVLKDSGLSGKVASGVISSLNRKELIDSDIEENHITLLPKAIKLLKSIY